MKKLYILLCVFLLALPLASAEIRNVTLWYGGSCDNSLGSDSVVDIEFWNTSANLYTTQQATCSFAGNAWGSTDWYEYENIEVEAGKYYNISVSRAAVSGGSSQMTDLFILTCRDDETFPSTFTTSDWKSDNESNSSTDCIIVRYAGDTSSASNPQYFSKAQYSTDNDFEAGTNSEIYGDDSRIYWYYHVWIPLTGGGGDTTHFEIKSATTNYWGDSILTYNATVNGTLYQTTNGTITTVIPNDALTTFDVSLAAFGHDPKTYVAWNVSTDLEPVLNLSYYRLNVSAKYNLTNSEATFNASIWNGTANTSYPGITGHKLINLSKDKTYKVYINSYEHDIVNKSILLDTWEESLYFSLFPDHYKLNITAYSFVGSNPIQNFSCTAANDTEVNGSTTAYYLILKLQKNLKYNVTIDAPGYAFVSETILMNNWTKYLNFSVPDTNSLDLTIRDEVTSTLLTSNVSILFSSVYGETTYYTTNGSFYIDDLAAAEYLLSFSTDGYGTRSYTVTVTNRSTQSLTVYMAASNSTTTFTVLDIDTGAIIDDVLVTMYRVINSTWSPVESKYTDITGRTQFVYLPNVNYKFYLSKSGYQDYLFYLNPILFSEYDVRMTRVQAMNTTTDYDRIALRYYPTSFYDGQENNFTFIIQSPWGELESYGYTLTYPGGTKSQSGFNAIGSQLNSPFNITGADFTDSVILNYYYETSLSGVRNFTYYLPIDVSANNLTMTHNRSTTYGLGIFETILISVLIFVLVTGIATLVGQPIGGFVLSLFLMGYFVYIGFIPWWSVGISLFVGVVMLMGLAGA